MTSSIKIKKGNVVSEKQIENLIKKVGGNSSIIKELTEEINDFLFNRSESPSKWLLEDLYHKFDLYNFYVNKTKDGLLYSLWPIFEPKLIVKND